MFQLCTVHGGSFRIINFTFPADAKKQTMYFSCSWKPQHPWTCKHTARSFYFCHTKNPKPLMFYCAQSKHKSSWIHLLQNLWFMIIWFYPCSVCVAEGDPAQCSRRPFHHGQTPVGCSNPIHGRNPAVTSQRQYVSHDGLMLLHLACSTITFSVLTLWTHPCQNPWKNRVRCGHFCFCAFLSILHCATVRALLCASVNALHWNLKYEKHCWRMCLLLVTYSEHTVYSI